MKKIISLALGGVMLAATALGSVAPAQAQSSEFGPTDYGFALRGNNDDWRWQRRHHRWNDDYGYYNRGRYYDHDRHYYRRHHHGFDGGDAAAVIFGLAAGAIAGGIVGSVGDDSYYRCRARYRSFDPDSWTYLGYDGYRHYCRL